MKSDFNSATTAGFSDLVNDFVKTIGDHIENMFELGRQAEMLASKHRLDYGDSREIYNFCLKISNDFEKIYDPDDGDYYTQLWEFAENRILSEYGKTAKPEPMREDTIYRMTMHQTCYVPENADSMDDCYSHSRLLALVHGDEHLCKRLFDTLDWQFPETLIDENVRDGLWGECKACGRYFDIGDREITECPHCHTKLPGDVPYDVVADHELGYEEGE